MSLEGKEEDSPFPDCSGTRVPSPNQFDRGTLAGQVMAPSVGADLAAVTPQPLTLSRVEVSALACGGIKSSGLI